MRKPDWSSMTGEEREAYVRDMDERQINEVHPRNERVAEEVGEQSANNSEDQRGMER